MSSPESSKSSSPQTEAPSPVRNGAGRPLRIFASVSFVVLWISLGFVLRLGPDAYLLLGIPLTAVFQTVIKREPLRALWLRSAPPLHHPRRFAAALVVLTPLPAYSLFAAVTQHRPASTGLWIVACLCGVVAAAYAIAAFDRAALTALLICLATGGAISMTLILLVSLAGHKAWAASALIVFGKWLLLYFPVSFTLEEVSFRGAIDAYIHRPGESHSWGSAFLVSAIWGLWHLPIVPHATFGVAIILVLVHTLLGVPLSFAWRRSGNLAAPAAVHALVDAFRNMLRLM